MNGDCIHTQVTFGNHKSRAGMVPGIIPQCTRKLRMHPAVSRRQGATKPVNKTSRLVLSPGISPGDKDVDNANVEECANRSGLETLYAC